MWYVVDGMDGCGKSSAAVYIKEHLEAKGRKVLLITHPNRDIKVGQKEAAWLLKDGTFAKLVATQYYIRDVIHSVRIMKKNKKTQEYDDVIFVRYIMAVSYVPKSCCKFAYRFFKILLPEPDVKYFVDVTAEVAMARIACRGEEIETFENLEDLTCTREKMHTFLYDNWEFVDNNGTPEETETQLAALLAKV